MRSTQWWTVVGVGLLAVIAMKMGTDHPVLAEPANLGAAKEDRLLMTTVDAANGGQHVVLIDTQQRVIGTYHVDAATGAVALKSVRNIRWDLMMNEFNGGEPKPNEIRALLEQN